ncbi:serine hydrolase [Proteus myxofaciens]|uniref:serine-type D-Ala-D-Ala carboxypeptidase n=1 Tax=Proteus myxofaciens ATCC 19692 TaxID=1354337 RepID=A0A198GTB3_9GAMM|nr:serine hydrolase [Proteus myxofaciens]OAT39476.1 D-alanyl-D-alanine carboxypeptidase [Proteus myxofaciens ATCC 19692]
MNKKIIASIATIPLISLLTVTQLYANEEKPIISAGSWVLMSYETGEVLVEQEGEKQIEPASLAKLMTSYLIAKSTSLDYIKNEDEVIIDKEAWAYANPILNGSPLMFLKADERVDISSLKKGLVIQSANDAAIALAKYMASSQEAFVEQMNKTAKDIGMVNTHFQNVHGLNTDNQYTSALDMARLVRQFIKDSPSDYQLYKESTFSHNGIKQYNRNKLLYQSKLDVDGLMTGTTSYNKYHIVSSAINNGIRYIAVVLDADSSATRFNEADKLLAWGFDNYAVYKPDITNTLPVRIWYGNKSELQVTYPEGTAIDIRTKDIDKIKINPVFNDNYISAPIKKGDVVGYTEFLVGDKQIATRELVATEDIDKGNIFENIWDFILQMIDKVIEDIKAMIKS